MIYVYIIIIISSGEVYMIDNPKSQGLEFYKKVKEEIDLEESYCAQPSGEFSTWFGNRYDYKTKLWNGYKGSKIMNTSIELIKDPSSPEEICLTNEFGKFRPRKCGDPTNRFCAFCDKFETNKPIYMKGFCEEMINDKYFDKEYFLDGNRNKRPFFRGVRNSFIYFEAFGTDSVERNGKWKIKSEKDDEHILMLSKEDSVGYPFGRFQWNLKSNSSICKVVDGGSISLTFSSCPTETFTCNSG